MSRNRIVPISDSCESCESYIRVDPAYCKTGETDRKISVRFNGLILTRQLQNFVQSVSLIPIQKYEVDLFELTKIFNLKIHGKAIDIRCVEKIHHVSKIVKGKIEVPGVSQEVIQAKVSALIKQYPMVVSQYEIFTKMLEVWNGLLVKWKIIALKNYSYRLGGRSLNIKMLDLNDINKDFMNLDVIWISSKIFMPPLNVIANPKLLELASLLHDQLSKSFNIFLFLNPKVIDQSYNIQKTLAYFSEEFFNWSQDECPEISLSSFKHCELKLISGISKCFRKSDPKIDFAFKTLADLEWAYREFERELMIAIMENTSYSSF